VSPARQAAVRSLPYRHTQLGILTIAASLAGVGVVAAAQAGLLGETDAPAWLLPVVGLVLVASGLTFATLTVRVTGRELSLWFGPGFPRKSLALRDIRDVRIVRNPWYYGWGIHLTPRGWLYNVSGTWAVEIDLERGRSLRVGSDEPARLLEAIELGRGGGA